MVITKHWIALLKVMFRRDTIIKQKMELWKKDEWARWEEKPGA